MEAGEIMAKRRDRAISIVLGVKERECDPHLPPEARAKLRKVILDQFNDLFSLAVDLLPSPQREVGVVVNDLYRDKLDRIDETLGVIRDMLEVS